MECRAHELALALFAPVDVELHGVDDRVVLGGVIALAHERQTAAPSRGAATDKPGQRRQRKQTVAAALEPVQPASAPERYGREAK